MKQFHQSVLATILALATIPAWAVNVVQCEDDQGNRGFHDACPPGTKIVGQKQYNTDSPAIGAQSLPEMVLYLVPNCDSCAQVKEFLKVRNLSATEKNVAQDVALQEELKEIAGDLRVPVLLIGDTQLSGYNREALLSALKQAGYRDEQPAAEAEEAEEADEAGDDDETTAAAPSTKAPADEGRRAEAPPAEEPAED